MKLQNLENKDGLQRPVEDRKSIADGSYFGKTVSAELVERESTYSEDGTRVVLNIKVMVEDDEGENVALYLSMNYNWSKKGNMFKNLEKLKCLPNPGEITAMDDLIGIPIKVVVENVEKDGQTYANIVSIKRAEEVTESKPMKKLPPTLVKKPIPVKKTEASKEVVNVFNDDKEEQSTEDSYDDLD